MLLGAFTSKLIAYVVGGGDREGERGETEAVGELSGRGGGRGRRGRGRARRERGTYNSLIRGSEYNRKKSKYNMGCFYPFL